MDSPSSLPERNHRRSAVDLPENGFTSSHSPNPPVMKLAPLTPTPTPPALPTRPSQQQPSNYPNTMNRPYYSGFGGGGMGGYGGYTPSYGGYAPMNRLGAPMMGDGGSYGNGRPSIAQTAENNVRSTLQSAENIIQAFTSVSMMLESSYFALLNSFRAVLSVADQLTLLRQQCMSILATALRVPLRVVRYFIRRVGVLLRVRSREDLAWTDVTTEHGVGGPTSAPGARGSQRGTNTPWPIIMFFVIFIGGPWLLYRWLSSLMNIDNKASGGCEEWASGNDDHIVARAEYDFNSQNQDEVSFRVGDIIRIAPKEKQPAVRGWLMGSVDGTVGYIPANYVTILGKRRGAIPTPADPPSDP